MKRFLANASGLLATCVLLYAGFRACALSAPVPEAPALPSPPSVLDYKLKSHMPTVTTSNAIAPAALQLAEMNKREAAARVAASDTPRIPLYVLPEVLVVQTPAGAVVFAPEFHVAELAKRFPAARMTNVVVWSRP